MIFCEESCGGSSIQHLNAELTRVETEISSVELSLRGLLRSFTVEQIARHARRDLISKPLNTLTGLQNFYCTVNTASLHWSASNEIQDSCT